ncbi:DotH/IcmK family type IV secretion protein (plasmid) [Stutzerimonas frequens]|uniref:DotH/IcmK family type IV secretion protein n=1 Tax=Stutzerimonas frequens TaxID=2968969 RepID=UPI002DB73043|nr:DotH/IcmK family type IV secretion protein [Stutzerimonas frequens]WRW29279.1 DotH/IcmK family type IV secretion protein [Stutzerimonas frequens]
MTSPLPLLAFALLLAAPFASAEEGNGLPVPDTAIESRTKQLLQADPKSILKMRKWIQDSSAARQAPLSGDFEPAIPQEVLDIEDFFEISLEPDQPAPKIFLARYQSTAVSFVDAYGNPWPIRKISNYLKGLVLIDKAVGETSQQVGDKSEKSQGSSGIDINDPQAGSFTMTALKHGAVGNITVYLQGLATPITILLVGKPSMYHRVATLRVSDVGPQTNANELFQGNGVSIGTEEDVDLNNALYGVSPVGSEQMVVEGADGKAWVKGEYLYVQTPIAVFSPEILRSSPGNGKYRAYKLPKTTAVMGTGTDGRTVTLRILRHPAIAIEAQTSLSKGGL